MPQNLLGLFGPQFVEIHYIILFWTEKIDFRCLVGRQRRCFSISDVNRDCLVARNYMVNNAECATKQGKNSFLREEETYSPLFVSSTGMLARQVRNHAAKIDYNSEE